MHPVFPVCAVTRAQARRLGDLVDLSDTFMSVSDPTSLPSSESRDTAPVVVEFQPDDVTMSLPVDKEELIKAQKNDASLSPCFSLVANPECD